MKLLKPFYAFRQSLLKFPNFISTNFAVRFFDNVTLQSCHSLNSEKSLKYKKQKKKILILGSRNLTCNQIPSAENTGTNNTHISISWKANASCFRLAELRNRKNICRLCSAEILWHQQQQLATHSDSDVFKFH